MCSLNNSLKYLSNAHDYAIFIIRIEIKIAQNVRNEVVIIIYAGDEMMAVKDSRARAVAWLQQSGWEAGYLSSLQGYPVAHLSERRSRNLAPVAPPTHDTTFNSSYIFLTTETTISYYHHICLVELLFFPLPFLITLLQFFHDLQNTRFAVALTNVEKLLYITCFYFRAKARIGMLIIIFIIIFL